jgi:hypothetical protein
MGVTRKIIHSSASIAALVAPIAPGFAQSFPKPPDVPAFSQVAPVYKTDGTANTLMDSTVTPMPVGSGLTNIPIPSTTNRLVTTSDQTEGTFTASISGTTMTVTAVASGRIRNGDIVYGPGVASGTSISSLGTGSGGAGTYNLNISQTVGSETMGSSNVSTYCLSTGYGGVSPCVENKFRTVVDFSHMLPDDPIRNYGQPGTSHLHCFFGAGSTNAYSTYKSLRAHALNSFAAGTDVNGTGYWFPCIEVQNPYGDGKNYAIKPNSVTVYYTENPATNGTGTGAKAFIPVGLRYVSGFDMDAVWNATTQSASQYAWLQPYLDAANTTIGHTRYTLTGPGGGSDVGVQYACVGATPSSTKVIVNADGSDPFGGTCGATTGGVASPGDFYIVFSAAQCYDGTNLWSPGGYKHLIPRIYDHDFSTWVCPDNYYRLPNLSIEIHFTQYGWTDRQRWDLSSDIAYRAKYGLTKAQLPPGTTFHTDWDDGWDDVQRRKWESNCNGVEHHTGHQCNTSQIDPTEYLKGGNGTECGVTRCPQVDNSGLPHSLETDPGWMLIPNAWSGGMTNMHIHN